MEINDEFIIEAKKKWGGTDQYKEFEEKRNNITKQKFENINTEMMKIFKEIGELKELSINDNIVQEKIKELKEFITDNYYNCSNEILYSLGQMYVNDARFKNNIDKVAGEGTAEFVSKAITVYCSKEI